MFSSMERKAYLYCDSCWVESTVTVLVHSWLLNLDFFLPARQDFPTKGKVNVKSSSFHNLGDVPTCQIILVSYILAVLL